ncbi:hypothetical protein [Afipia sp. GAS231]|uniref:hypothetical protein n=1 Tax=Afipia sp. GAS231 TaxID=1882747 RepID=UPI000879FE0B|nr:hypothetical protein [Afipia sp. GAS231]SDP44777.1 hypothetical protein SAMN05444050_6891 [Afipia sp. GAS231]
MLENPFLLPPQVESPQSRSWGRGFAFGFQGPPASLPTPGDVEDTDAFQQGVAAGQDAATNGLDVFPDACVDLNAERPPGLDLTPAGFEAITIGRELFHKAFGGAIFSAVLLIIDLSIGFQTHFDDPAAAMQAATGALQQLLANMGISDSMELFIGGGVDTNVAHCELKLTPVFRSESAARSAAQALGRPKFLVVSWRTDQSGGMTLVDSNF